MFDSMAYISGDWVTDLIITVTGSLFLVFSFKLLSSTRVAKRRLSGVLSIKHANSEPILKPNELDSEQLSWVNEHLVYTPVDEGYKVDQKNGLWLSKTPLSLMTPNIDPNRYKLVPALLTSIGITGTFLGITIGLSQFSMAGDSKALLTSAAELLEGMKTAFYTSLAGLSTSALFMAFVKWSSSSISNAQHKFQLEISKNYFEASAIYYLKDLGSEGRREAIDAQVRTADAVEKLGTNINTALTSFSDASRSLDGDMIAEKISDSVTSAVNTQMVPVLNAIKSELATLKEIKEQSQQELVTFLVKEMKSELIEPVTAELKNTSDALNESNKVTNELNSNVEKVVTTTSETVKTINGFQVETMVKLQGFAESLKSILTRFNEETQGAMGTIASEVKGMLSDASEGMNKQRIAFEESSQRAASAFEGIKESMDSALSERKEAEQALFVEVEKRISVLLTDSQDAMKTITSQVNVMLESASNGMDKQRVAFEESSQRAATAFEGIKDAMDSSLSERQQAEQVLFSNVEKRIGTLLEESQTVFEKQTDVLESVGAEASQLMNSAKTELISGLGDIDTKVINMSNTVQTELEAFRKQYQENLTEFFTRQNNLLESSLGKQRDGLNGVVDNFRKVFEEEYQTRHGLLQELTAQYQKLEKSAQTLERVAKAIGLNDSSKMAELQNAATTMSQEISSLKKEYTTASAAFTQVTEELPKAMDDYYARATKSFETFFNDFDHASSKIHNRLAQAANYLVSAQEVRQEVAQDKVEV
ncbi:hypothetical protein [Vibrio sp. HENC-03]|uniref:hypothetical protein n=1 Tax=Vibrio sp. HENC-03 TaxID=992012 RepID=UPI00028E041A|nr:hypothetical protein [Vibrio sp. HENC-03]EKM24781.1 hypothetical protein VCHENC03_0832 [Vibrio sp. HENC-03]